MNNSTLMLAIENNADWCWRVWRSHGLLSYQGERLWSCVEEVPDFYPNVVTLQQGGDDMVADIAKVRAQYAGQRFSVKDSFAELDLGALGLRRLFDAQWLCLAPETRRPAKPSLDWAPVTSDEELAGWEIEWDIRAAGSAPIFRPALLADPTVTFWAGRSAGALKAGYISNITGAVVGLSNTFGRYEDCLAHAAHQFPAHQLVTYEPNEASAPALNLGFEALGDLTIWILA